jgi:hypothetical protein
MKSISFLPPAGPYVSLVRFSTLLSKLRCSASDVVRLLKLIFRDVNLSGLRFFKKFWIVTVFAVNRAEHTHCCELTPSYNLCAVAHEPVFTTGVDAPEAARECIWNFVNQVPVVESSHYRHVRCVDRYVENNPVMVYRVGELDVEDYPTTREQEDRMIDIWHSNPKF